MSAIILISGDSSWNASLGLFDSVLDLISSELDTTLTDLASDAQIHRRLDYWDIQSVNIDQFEMIYWAVLRIYEKEFYTGKERKTHFSGFGAYGLQCLSELKAVLRLDVRNNNRQETASGKIILQDDLIWEAPIWLYDLLLEILAAHIAESVTDLSVPNMLMNSRFLVNKSKCDLHSLSDEQLSLFTQHMDMLNLRYVVSGVFKGQGKGYQAVLLQHISQLYQLFRADSRIHAWPTDPDA